jgi:hypothetical protein
MKTAHNHAASRAKAPTVDDMLEVALQADLNAWEAGFVKSVWDWHNSGRRPSGKQLQVLAEIAAKALMERPGGPVP